MDKHVFEAVLVGVLQHRTQRFHARSRVELGIGELGRSVTRHLGQQARRVVVSVYAVRLGVGGDFCQQASKAQREITILIVTVTVQERDHWRDIEVDAARYGLTTSQPRAPPRVAIAARDKAHRRFGAKPIHQINCQQSHDRSGHQYRPKRETFKSENFECASQQQFRQRRGAAQAEQEKLPRSQTTKAASAGIVEPRTIEEWQARESARRRG